jgi:UDP-3-O-[3-hydroxymyristoyl] glucosamine N-acyltransferase
MTMPVFFRRAETPSIAEIAAWTGASLQGEGDPAALIAAVAPIDQAGAGALTFLDNPRYAADLERTAAAACLVTARYASKVPAGTLALVVAEPYRAVATVLARLYPDAMRPASIFGGGGISPGAFIHPEARLEPDVTIDPGAVIGPRAEIGSRSVIGANAVIGPDVRIGRACSIGPQATILNALVGNKVIVHPGARIGQDGFGFAMGPRGHAKVAQIGRVIIQDDVEIGANSTIDRGSNRDTIVGEGTKIDNLVQIAHNVVIGRHCVIVSQSGISGSTAVGDFVAIGGQAGLTGHLKIGAGAQIGAQAGVMADVPAGARIVGSPAQPVRDLFKQTALLKRLAARSGPGEKRGDADGEGGGA